MPILRTVLSVRRRRGRRSELKRGIALCSAPWRSLFVRLIACSKERNNFPLSAPGTLACQKMYTMPNRTKLTWAQKTPSPVSARIFVSLSVQKIEAEAVVCSYLNLPNLLLKSNQGRASEDLWTYTKKGQETNKKCGTDQSLTAVFVFKKCVKLILYWHPIFSSLLPPTNVCTGGLAKSEPP